MVIAVRQHTQVRSGFWYLWLALFILAAIGLNSTRLPLFFSIEFIFGSAIAVLTLIVLGRVAAVVVGVIAAAVTLYIWGHPYAWFVFSAEIIWLSWRWQPDRGLNLVQRDLLFWLFAGVPLVSVCYALGLNASWQSAVMIAIKQMTNGVFNTLLASLVILVLQLRSRSGSYLNLPLLSLKQLLFHILVAITLFTSCAFLLLDARKLQAEYVNSVEQRLDMLAGELRKQLQKAQEPPLVNAQDMPDLQQVVFADAAAAILLLDNKGAVLSVSGVLSSVIPSEQFIPPAGFAHWQPKGVSPLLTRWKQSRYVLVVHPAELSGIGAIILEHSAIEVMTKLERDSAQKLMLLVGFLMFSVIIASWLSRVISEPLNKLALASEKLKKDISAGINTEFPLGNVAEYDSLGRNLRMMSSELKQAFTQSKTNESQLSCEVAERTMELQQSKGQLEAILAAASDFSIIATAPDGVITFFSRGAEKLLGYHAEELVKKQTPAILHVPEEVQQRANELSAELNQPIAGFAAFVAVAQRKGTETRQWHYVCKNGQKVPVSLTVTPITDGGAISGYLGVAKDISKRNRNEQLKNEFISTVSHELRTPLTSLYAALRLVNSGKLGILPAKVMQLLQLAESNSKRLGRLINDLLDVEKLASGKFQLTLEVQPLQPLVIQAIDEITSYAEHYNVSLVTDYALEPLLAKVDAPRFVQIVTNLLSNAIKFSPAGDVITLRLYADIRVIRLEVSDKGQGIADDFKQRIFERFAQSDATNTRQQGGTGLGLAISKELTEKMAGNIGFVSEPGQGATFWLSFQRYTEANFE